MIKCVIADDELIARQILEQYILNTPGLVLTATCRNALETFDLLGHAPVDLLFLDIEMPLVSGIQLLKSLSEPPGVIFTTAYAEHALDGYELGVIDYLLKPFSPERFQKAVQKAVALMAPKDTGHILVKDKDGTRKVLYRDILYIEASGDYMKIHILKEGHSPARPFLVHQTMKKMEETLPGDTFIRTHKSYIVALAHVQLLKTETVLLTGPVEIPLSPFYKESVTRHFTMR